MPAEGILLVGGQGTRLRPLTLTVPKPLLPVGGVPVVVQQVTRLHDAGVEHVVLATSLQADIFRDVLGNGSTFGMQVDYVEEKEPLGTAGAMRNAASALIGAPDDAVVVLNGDVLSGHDLRAQLQQHMMLGCDVTLHLVEVDDARTFGCVPTDDDGRVLAFLEKMDEPVTPWVNAGAYAVRRRLLDDIPAGRAVSVERDTFPSLLAAGCAVHAWRESAYWLDLGTPANYVRGNRDVVLGRVLGTVLGGELSDEVAVAHDADVAPGAVVSGGSWVGAKARVADGATVSSSVLLDGARVGAAHVESSVVGPGAQVGDGVVLVDAVVGADAVIGSGNELRAGTRVWPGVELGPTSIRFSSDA